MKKDLLNEWVVEKLDSHGWSMGKLARESGISQSYISKVLSGKRTASLDFYVKVAKVFDDIPGMLISAGLFPAGISKEITFTKLVRYAQQLTPKQRREAIEYLLWLTHRDRSRQEKEEDE